VHRNKKPFSGENGRFAARCVTNHADFDNLPGFRYTLRNSRPASSGLEPDNGKVLIHLAVVAFKSYLVAEHLTAILQ
jgi:hypothetical protein